MGIFDAMQQSGIGGMFGNINQRISPYAQNNQSALLAAGTALMDGQGWSGAAKGFLGGGQLDQERQRAQMQDRMLQQGFMDNQTRMGWEAKDRYTAQQQQEAQRQRQLQDEQSAAKRLNQTQQHAIKMGMDPGMASSLTGQDLTKWMLEQSDQPEYDKDRIGGANSLRDDLRTDLATANLVSEGAQQIHTLYNNPGAVSDYALAVAFAKIVDPGSVAREGEVAAVSNAGARFPALLKSLTNAVDGKGRMTDEMKTEIAQLAAKIANEKITSAQGTIDKYRTTSEQMGIPFDWIYQGSGFSPLEIPQMANPPSNDGDGTYNASDVLGRNAAPTNTGSTSGLRVVNAPTPPPSGVSGNSGLWGRGY